MEEISKEDLGNRQISSHFIDSETSAQDSLPVVTLSAQAPGSWAI